MAYRITGLDPALFLPLFALGAEELAARRAARVVADADRGFPCRVTLEDARAGEALVLVNYLSHDAETPYRTAHAIYVREGARRAADYIDSTPPVFDGRPLSLRGFGADGMLKAASLTAPGETDHAIRAMLADERIACIHAHNAAQGCFAARIERHGESGR
jgi:hypothetical protein